MMFTQHDSHNPLTCHVTVQEKKTEGSRLCQFQFTQELGYKTCNWPMQKGKPDYRRCSHVREVRDVTEWERQTEVCVSGQRLLM